jgi:hypothetical protein
MKLFTAVILAVSLAAVGAASADAPPAKPMMHKSMKPMMHKPMAMHPTMHMGHGHMSPMCAEGMTKMACMCKGASAMATCKGGQWCHTWAGTCTM